MIRAVGLYFAYCALTAFFSLAASVPDLFTLPKIDAPAKESAVPFDASSPMPGLGEPIPTPDPAKKEREKIESELKAAALKAFLFYLGLTALYAVGAWYFMTDGRFVHEVLVREEPSGPEGSQREVTSLNLDAGRTNEDVAADADAAAPEEKTDDGTEAS